MIQFNSNIASFIPSNTPSQATRGATRVVEDEGEMFANGVKFRVLLLSYMKS